uniref:NADH-ubiquinone oxidoreductase chain 2 n=1 Tax=Agonita chinensis TaxID=2003340 RepID=A0A343SEN1_9CUCU|nr:NADH dehydrogenase subunit 2 [Agonita chinensis]
MTKFYKLFFFNFVVMGTLISISSFSWFSMWMGMEINLISFIPIMKDNNSKSSESMSKYFIIQALASSILLLSIIMMNFSLMNWNMITPQSIMFFSLITKLGMAPTHFWLVEVVEGLNWWNCFWMLTWQKIAPFVFLMFLNKNLLIFYFSIIISTFISTIQGLGQISMRKIMTYSSINHMAWMMCSLMNNFIWCIYIFLYLITNFNLIMMFNKFKIFYINQIYNMNMNLMLKLFILLNFLSLSGLPPFIGFLPKWLTIMWMIENNFIFMPLLITTLTLISIFFYIRIMIPSMLNYMKMKKKINMKLNFYYLMFNFMFFSSLILLSWTNWM